MGKLTIHIDDSFRDLLDRMGEAVKESMAIAVQQSMREMAAEIGLPMDDILDAEVKCT